jgi:hypothetical protein
MRCTLRRRNQYLVNYCNNTVCHSSGDVPQNPSDASIDPSIDNYYYRSIIDSRSMPYVIPLLLACRTNSTRANLGPPLSRGSAMRARGASLALPFARQHCKNISGWEQRFMPCSHSRRSSLLLAKSRAPIIWHPLTSKDHMSRHMLPRRFYR